MSSSIKCWEAVEDVAIRGHQRLLNEQVHLERCCGSSCHINLNISEAQEAGPVLGVRGLRTRTGLSVEVQKS